MAQLRALGAPHVQELRGRGLMRGVQLQHKSGPARPFCEGLMKHGILAKETHEQVVRFAPPLVVEKVDLEWALGHTAEVLEGAAVAT
jgi:ornithine--oxo-acid transaminase